MRLAETAFPFPDELFHLRNVALAVVFTVSLKQTNFFFFQPSRFHDVVLYAQCFFYKLVATTPDERNVYTRSHNACTKMDVPEDAEACMRILRVMFEV